MEHLPSTIGENIWWNIFFLQKLERIFGGTSSSLKNWREYLVEHLLPSKIGETIWWNIFFLQKLERIFGGTSSFKNWREYLVEHIPPSKIGENICQQSD